jgi:hypothetical protein
LAAALLLLLLLLFLCLQLELCLACWHSLLLVMKETGVCVARVLVSLLQALPLWMGQPAGAAAGGAA